MAKEIEVKDPATLGISVALLRHSGANTELVRLLLPKPGKRARIIDGTAKEIADQLAGIFTEQGMVS